MPRSGVVIPWRALVFVIFLTVVTLAHAQENEEKEEGEPDMHILILGGNGFMGSDTVVALKKAGHYVAILNRGHLYWDAEERVLPLVDQHIICDRQKLDECEELKNDGSIFDVVVDFIGFEASDIDSIMKYMEKTVESYIYISSDSVYEVCDTSGIKGFLEETDAVRPKTLAEQKRMAKKDRYGNGKLNCETKLSNNQEFINFVNLRLPDVLGARDNTDRVLGAITTVLEASISGDPIYITSGEKETLMSFVWSQDVATEITRWVEMKDGWDQPYNIACDEKVNMETFYAMISEAIGQKVKVEVDEDKADNYFPSVTKGPISIKKALKAGFKPTPLQKVIKETTNFYIQQILNDTDSIKSALSDVYDSDEKANQMLLSFQNYLKENKAQEEHAAKKRKEDVKEEL